MKSYDYFLKILKALGYKDDENICDYWFEHRDAIRARVIHRMQPDIDTFELQIRWKSSIGLVCNEAVRQYLNEKKRQNYELLQTAVSVESSPPLANIDFIKFQFPYENKSVSLDDFVRRFPTSKIGGWSDLRGINLTGISIENAVISNANFAYASFQGSNLFQIKLHNVNLVSTDLRSSRVVNVTLADHSGIPGADLRGAFINILRGINDKSVAYPFKYAPVSALYLIRALILSLFTDRNLNFDNAGTHTRFLANDVSGISAPDSKMLRRYIDWYQYVLSRLATLRNQTIKDKIFFSLAIVTTKAWSSYVSLAVTGLVLNLLFALMFNLNYSDFNGLDNKYFSALYYSIVTFTTLGYGDITPESGWARLMVVSDVVLGYLTLGVFVYLLSRKVEDKF